MASIIATRLRQQRRARRELDGDHRREASRATAVSLRSSTLRWRVGRLKGSLAALAARALLTRPARCRPWQPAEPPRDRRGVLYRSVLMRNRPSAVTSYCRPCWMPPPPPWMRVRESPRRRPRPAWSARPRQDPRVANPAPASTSPSAQKSASRFPKHCWR
jgi:hypothetical protein